MPELCRVAVAGVVCSHFKHGQALGYAGFGYSHGRRRTKYLRFHYSAARWPHNCRHQCLSGSCRLFFMVSTLIWAWWLSTPRGRSTLGPFSCSFAVVHSLRQAHSKRWSSLYHTLARRHGHQRNLRSASPWQCGVSGTAASCIQFVHPNSSHAYSHACSDLHVNRKQLPPRLRTRKRTGVVTHCCWMCLCAVYQQH